VLSSLVIVIAFLKLNIKKTFQDRQKVCIHTSIML
jgi:hypothetical protein